MISIRFLTNTRVTPVTSGYICKMADGSSPDLVLEYGYHVKFITYNQNPYWGNSLHNQIPMGSSPPPPSNLGLTLIGASVIAQVRN